MHRSLLINRIILHKPRTGLVKDRAQIRISLSQKTVHKLFSISIVFRRSNQIKEELIRLLRLAEVPSIGV